MQRCGCDGGAVTRHLAGQIQQLHGAEVGVLNFVYKVPSEQVRVVERVVILVNLARTRTCPG